MSENNLQTIEAEAQEVTEHGTAVVAHEHDQRATATLFRTDDPVEVVEKATRAANALKSVLVERKMVTRIGRSEHVNVEGWQTLGAMLGVTPVKEWVREIPWPDDLEDEALRKLRGQGYAFGYEASYAARTLDERTIGSGEGECKRTEGSWQKRDDFALKSMAQTRATSRALGGPLRFVVTLAGYSGTPAEEMPHGQQQQQQRQRARATAKPREQATEKPATAAQKGKLNKLFGDAGLANQQVTALTQWLAGKSQVDRLTAKQASEVIATLTEQNPQAVLADIVEQAGDAEAPQHERATKIAARYLQEDES